MVAILTFINLDFAIGFPRDVYILGYLDLPKDIFMPKRTCLPTPQS